MYPIPAREQAATVDAHQRQPGTMYPIPAREQAATKGEI